MVVEFVLSMVVSVVVVLLVYSLLAGRLKLMEVRMGQIGTKLEEVTKYSEVGRLKEEFQKFGQDILSRIESLKRLSSEEMSKVRDDITKLAEQRSVDAAVNHIRQISITRDEFERLREMVTKMGGREEAIERLDFLQNILQSTDIRVITWQCKLIHLLEGGLAPEAEADQIVSEGIPLGSAKEFLKTLQRFDVISSKRVESFWLNPDYSWLTTYTKEPDWLKKQLENLVKKEAEYEKYIREKIDALESGLIVVSEQYELPSGKVDIYARDRNGKDVCLELKYPIAASGVVGQLLKYREDVKTRTGENPRCILVAPTIPDKTKQLLAQNGMEHIEVEY